jgi:hypothetical protein
MGEALLLIPSVGIPTGGGNAVSWMRTSQKPEKAKFAEAQYLETRTFRNLQAAGVTEIFI